ncbi:MAG TPA: rhodanese-like domain-containing protein [Stellaceae bacterium]|nr:rhodanese-like domain-containing protein [Stellaceae bacterium]
MSLLEQRREAIERTLERVRRIEAEQGVTRASLEALKPVLVELAARAELFPPEHFPISPNGHGRVYRLAEDLDRRFALYASAGVPGKAQPPHNHTTWAVIAGVFGDEHNVFYDRTDDRATPGIGRLRKTGELTVRRGNACALLPDDFHTIEVTGGKPSLHLHLYGMSLENLPERIFFPASPGGAYRAFGAPPDIAPPLLPAAELKAMLRDGEELAILDLREEGVFAEGHLFYAASLPLSRLELRLDALVPRRGTRIVLCDDGDGLAQRAALKLMHWGYRSLAALAGGVKGWQAAGFELFSGVHVPSKAFGEFIEHEAGTPRLGAEEVKALMERGADLVVLDSRPMDEYRKMSIPGGIDCPGGELVYRFHDLVRSPETLVVVNCAGRTRSIIGAQSLINAGVPNRVAALKNGTMGWHLAGFALAHDESAHAPDPTPSGLAAARAAAARVAERAGVEIIAADALQRFRREQKSRTLYLFDVRTPEEYAAGHLPGARSAPGGQLVQATDGYMATLNARVVLVDSDGVRARMTASWLKQMGLEEVYVLDRAEGMSEAGHEPLRILGREASVAALGARELAQLQARGEAVVVDLDPSLVYREQHIPGAWFAIRARLETALARLPERGTLVLTSRDGVLAALAAPEAQALTPRPVKVLAGGTAAWRAAGLPLSAGEEHMADAPIDAWYRPYDKPADVEAAMNAYLRWEVALIEQIARDGDARFRALGRIGGTDG